MQELIETFEEMRSPIDSKVDVDFAISLMKSMLEREKDEIIDAHIDGQCDETEGYPVEIAEKYYNETFNTKEKMVEDEMDYKKEYYRLYQEVAEMLVENRRNYKTPMTPFELLLRWDKIREVKNTFNTKEK